jgi:hypothetical protein
MTPLRTIRTPIGPESQLAQGDWHETKTMLQLIRASVGPVYLMMLSGDGLSS